MKEFDRGIILSKKYNNVEFNKIVYVLDSNGEKSPVTLNLKDNVINLDPTVNHKIQMSLILQNFYPDKMAMDWIFYLMDIKHRDEVNHIGFHLTEIIYASFLASYGEIVILNCELEENYGNSSLYFLPKDLSVLTEKQKRQLQQLLPMILTREFVEVCSCDSCYENNEYAGRERLLHLIGQFNINENIQKK